jgi:glutathione S-transferase
MIRIIGNHVSPYAKKVYVALAMKGVAHEVDPVVPFLASDAFTALSPLRRIPVLIDGDLVLNDSTVICEYLDEMYPDPPLMPRSPADRARARWMEEYADTRLGDVVLWKLFFQKLVGPRVLKQPTDEILVEQALTTDLPQIMDWMEPQAPAGGFLFGEHPMMADIAWAAILRNAALVGWTPDAARWPRVAGWIARTAALPAFAESVRLEQVVLTTRPADQPAALAAAGVRVAADSLAGREPRPRVMERT